MRRRDQTGGKAAKTQHRKALKRRGAPKAARHAPVAGKETNVARLTRERDEALEQLAATSEVLNVISGSSVELEPVFSALLANAVRLCEAKFGTLYLCDEGGIILVASHNAAFAETRRGKRFNPPAGTALGEAYRTKQPARVADLAATRPYNERHPAIVQAVEVGGVRSGVSVPLLKGDELLGLIGIFRQEVRPFTDKQIELVKNFAAQAVIAIENTRLLNELRQRTDDLTVALEQQTATSEVLKVISSSPGDLEPVFNTMLANATRICAAKIGILFRYEDGAYTAMATLGVTPAYAEYLNRGAIRPGPTTGLGRVASSKQTAHIIDTQAEGAYADREPLRVATAELGGARTLLNVPMLKEGVLVGAIGIYRQEVRPFTDKQIELVTNFAAQAVIAIENTRLLKELWESLQQQTATADVLKAIAGSGGELALVFETMLENAVRICEASYGNMWLCEGEDFRTAALHGPLPPTFVEKWRSGTLFSPGPGVPSVRAAKTRRPVQVADLRADQAYLDGDPLAVSGVEEAGMRTTVAVPMLKENRAVGVIVIYRKEVRAFSDKQIELLSNFAAQAVIAIENARLLTELRQRTDDLSKSLEELRTTQDRLVQTQKLALLGQLTAGIAHEIKNPLNFVNNFSGISAELIDELRDTLKGMPLDDKARTEINELTDTLKSNFDKVVHHGRRADAIVKNMLQHSREGSGEHRVIDINALVEESLNLAWHGARAETQGFEVKLKQSFDPSAGGADVFPQDIRRALLNLIANGFYAATRRRAETNGGGYEPTLTASTKNLGDRVEVRIRDNGTGMTPDVKEKMFNPFFTTKPAGEGTGLGLSISHDVIVKQHAGIIEVDTQPGEFTEIRVVLPRTPAFV